MSTRWMRIAAVGLTVVAVVACGFLLFASWSLTTAYGSSAIDPWAGAPFWALGPSLLLAVALWWDLHLLGRRAAVWVVVAGCFAALVAATALTLTLAGRHHDAAIVAAACSQTDVQILMALPLEAPARTRPVGDARGGCSVVVSMPGETAALTSSVSHAMQADGWLQWGSGTKLTFSRGSANLTVSAEPSGPGTTVIRVTVLDEGNDAFPPGSGS